MVIQTSDDFRRSLVIAARFRQYSSANVLVILAWHPPPRVSLATGRGRGSAGKHDGAMIVKAVVARVQSIAHRLIAGILEDDEPLPQATALGEGPRLAA